MIAHQPVEAIEILPHVRRAGCNIDPRRRSKPEHRLHPVQYGQQRSSVPASNPRHTSIRRPLRNSTTEHHRAWRRLLTCPRSGGNHFDRNKSPASRLPSTMHALTIFIQRPYRQATLLAKGRPHQSTRFKLRNQGLDLGQTTPSVHHSHFAHSSSATLNARARTGCVAQTDTVMAKRRGGSSKSEERASVVIDKESVLGHR
jgi:hypothetical protein